MSDSSSHKNGLLMLYEAAMKLEEQEDQWDHHYSTSATSSYSHPRPHTSIIRSNCSASYSAYSHQRRSSPPASSTKCTHNELEKSRRAHLRACMEALKDRLSFDADSVTRITMLSVLKKASGTIQNINQRNQILQNQEAVEKKRWTHLSARRQALRKRMEHDQRFRAFKRNRNFSECSAVTTSSSEESELDFYNGHMASTPSAAATAATVLLRNTTLRPAVGGGSGPAYILRAKLMVPPASAPIPIPHKNLNAGVVSQTVNGGSESPDGSSCSSDSGYEEISPPSLVAGSGPGHMFGGVMAAAGTGTARVVC